MQEAGSFTCIRNCCKQETNADKMLLHSCPKAAIMVRAAVFYRRSAERKISPDGRYHRTEDVTERKISPDGRRPAE